MVTRDSSVLSLQDEASILMFINKPSHHYAATVSSNRASSFNTTSSVPAIVSTTTAPSSPVVTATNEQSGHSSSSSTAAVQSLGVGTMNTGGASAIDESYSTSWTRECESILCTAVIRHKAYTKTEANMDEKFLLVTKDLIDDPLFTGQLAGVDAKTASRVKKKFIRMRTRFQERKKTMTAVAVENLPVGSVEYLLNIMLVDSMLAKTERNKNKRKHHKKKKQQLLNHDDDHDDDDDDDDDDDGDEGKKKKKKISRLGDDDAAAAARKKGGDGEEYWVDVTANDDDDDDDDEDDGGEEEGEGDGDNKAGSSASAAASKNKAPVSTHRAAKTTANQHRDLPSTSTKAQSDSAGSALLNSSSSSSSSSAIFPPIAVAGDPSSSSLTSLQGLWHQFINLHASPEFVALEMRRREVELREKELELDIKRQALKKDEVMMTLLNTILDKLDK